MKMTGWTFKILFKSINAKHFVHVEGMDFGYPNNWMRQLRKTEHFVLFRQHGYNFLFSLANSGYTNPSLHLWELQSDGRWSDKKWYDYSKETAKVVLATAEKDIIIFEKERWVK
jgi:hypothetical protein